MNLGYTKGRRSLSTVGGKTGEKKDKYVCMEVGVYSEKDKKMLGYSSRFKIERYTEI